MSEPSHGEYGEREVVLSAAVKQELQTTQEPPVPASCMGSVLLLEL